MFARTGDISPLIQFDWYQYVWYIDPPTDTAQYRRKLGRKLGVADNFGTAMTYFILPKSTIVVARSSVTPVTPEKMMSNEGKAKMIELDESIEQKIGDERTNEEVALEFPNVPQIPEDVFVDEDTEMSDPKQTNSPHQTHMISI
jgi:hypothetical protein